MLQKISGEQPFQILNNSFTISPSNSGYDLYFSADGEAYSYFLTVPANTNKQIIDMNEGNFYKLIGNTDEVTVNWRKDCGGHSGGGGEGGSINDAGSETNPIYTKNGKAIACPTSTEGKRWGTVPRVRETDGVMEVGKYLDFHSTSDGRTDFDGRLQVENKTLYFRTPDSLLGKKVLLEGDAAGSNYSIVDELPSDLVSYALSEGEEDTNPATPNVEGQMAWLKTEYGEKEATIVRVNQIEDSFLTLVRFGYQREWGLEEFATLACDVWRNEGGDYLYHYHFEGNIQFDLVRDDEWHSYRIGNNKEFGIYVRRNENAYDNSISFILDDTTGELGIEWVEDTENRYSKGTYMTTIKTREGAQYIYSDEFGWKKNIYDLDSMNALERVKLFEEVKQYQLNGKAFPYPITFNYNGRSYRATDTFVRVDAGVLEISSVNGESHSIVYAHMTGDGFLSIFESGLVDASDFYIQSRCSFIIGLNLDGTENLESEWNTLPDVMWETFEALGYGNIMSPRLAPIFYLNIKYQYFNEWEQYRPLCISPVTIYKSKAQIQQIVNNNDFPSLERNWTFVSEYFNPILEKKRKMVATSTFSYDEDRVIWDIQFMDA